MKTFFFALYTLIVFSTYAMEQKHDCLSFYHNTKDNTIITYFIEEFEHCYKKTTVIKYIQNNSMDAYYTTKGKNDDNARELYASIDGYYRNKEELLKKYIQEFESQKELQK